MDQVLVDFWWSGDILTKKLHLLAASELRKSKAEGGLGFKCFCDFNLAFVAKLAWRILTNPASLWVQLLKGLYFPRSYFLQVSRHHKSSWLWSGVMEGRKALLQGLRKSIGDGYGTSIIEAWIPEAQGFKSSCSSSYSSTKVSDYINHSHRTWNIEKLRSVFPEEVIKQIILIPLGPEGHSDQLVWHFESSRNFSVRSCYRHLRAMTIPHNQPADESTKKLWKWLWQLDLPPKIKFFLWRVCRNAVPTKAGLFRKGCGNSLICLTCNDNEETLEHLLFHCPVSLSFWQQIMPLLHYPAPDQQTKSWFSTIASSVSDSTATQIGFTIWYIWKMRNELVFQNISPSLSDLSSRRMYELQQWNSNAAVRNTVSSLVGNSGPSSVQLTSSLAPTSYSYRVVCDGAFKASIQKGAYGVIVYNAEGNVVNGRAGSEKCAAPVCAEAYAVLRAIELVKTIDTPTVIYSDCSVLVDSTAGHQLNWPWSISSILASITRMLYWNQNIHVSKASRTTIQLAHSIAVQARDDSLSPDWLSLLDS
ncbi:Putative ribonuclease H protein At1g65750 [Linum perenne]